MRLNTQRPAREDCASIEDGRPMGTNKILALILSPCPPQTRATFASPATSLASAKPRFCFPSKTIEFSLPFPHLHHHTLSLLTIAFSVPEPPLLHCSSVPTAITDGQGARSVPTAEPSV
ncbi:hypothetical protein PIB30_084789 [Stylosanthes scabra]|uniref:Uncharacterized protein n=1 Tax=Stylosanthes scabra TaxID=79078 RepID=A0ABU6URG8_9FABA|nr:hypothetical protein [Stylosanthes scabra]